MADRDASRVRTLTPRRKEVALLVARGLSNEEIADRLDVSIETVKTHVAHCLGLMGVATRKGLAAATVTTLMDYGQRMELANLPVVAGALARLPDCDEEEMALLNKMTDAPDLGNAALGAKKRVEESLRQKLGVGGHRFGSVLLVVTCLLARLGAADGLGAPTSTQDITFAYAESQVLIRLASGKTDQAIAAELDLKTDTVRSIIRRTPRLIGKPLDRTELALYVVRTLLTSEQRAQWRGAAVVRLFRTVIRDMSPQDLAILDALVTGQGATDEMIANQLGLQCRAVREVIGWVTDTCGFSQHPYARLMVAVCRELTRG
ncbi:MAG TPA: LuxR C-terminal-related transcriptional regulator [Candidatus Saccharimonadales bacterium]|nr:LuxR C-terminal-related transcriptional regulator [Candidatus Saccharimonadales bacterium]